MSKGEKVFLDIVGVSEGADPNEEPERLALRLTGRLTFLENGAWQLDYTEQAEHGEESKVRITVEGAAVTMLRTGETETCMVFEKGRRFDGSYQTRFGALDLGVFATEVEMLLVDGPKGYVHLAYQLDLQGGFAAVHSLDISIRPA